MNYQARRPVAGGQPQASTPRGDQSTRRIDYDAIIVRGDAAVLVDTAQRIGQDLARQRLTTSQIRGVFGSVRRIEMNWSSNAPEAREVQAQRELILLKPKLAYQARRQGEAVQELANVLNPAIDLVGSDRTRFRNFVDFFEAILAYHRSNGGR